MALFNKSVLALARLALLEGCLAAVSKWAGVYVPRYVPLIHGRKGKDTRLVNTQRQY